MLLLAWLSWPFFLQSYAVNEWSSNAGGLLRWPVKLVLPVGFVADRAAGPVRGDQAHRRAARLRADRCQVRETDCSGRALRSQTAMITLRMMPPLMFGGLVLFMLVGYPVAFSLAALGIAFGFVAIDHGFFTIAYLQAIPGRVFGNVLSNDLLLAMPFFTFMGAILERCGLAEDMLDSMGQLFGPIRGGLGYSVIIVGFILGAITGTVAAQVIAMALISMPVMIRYKYNIRYTTGVLAASGTITQLVPPSLVLIVLADQLGKSVGDMYLGAWGPSVIQIALFALYTFALSHPQARMGAGGAEGGAHADRLGAVEEVPDGHRPVRRADLRRARHHDARADHADRGRRHGRGRRHRARGDPPPAVQPDRQEDLPARHRRDRHRNDRRACPACPRRCSGSRCRCSTSRSSWLCIEAARIPDLRDLIRQGYQTTMRITAMVIFILIGSTCFSIVFLGVDGSRWLEHMLSSLPGGAWGFLAFINLFIFFLAFFLDFFEIAFIILPMIAPVAQKILAPIVGADAALIWFGVMLCVNMQTSFMHPPFGFALFYLRGVAPRSVSSADIYWGALPWVGLQLIMVALVIAFPVLVTGLLDAPSTIDPSKIRIDIQSPASDEPPPLVIFPTTPK